MILPKALLAKYEESFNLYRVPVSYIEQKVLQKFMEEGYWDRHIQKMNIATMKRHDFLIKTVKEYMGDKVSIHGQNGGLHIVLELKNGLKEEDIISRAKDHDIMVGPMSIFWMRKDKYTDNMVMLGYGGMDEEEIVDGIKLLTKALFNE